MKMKQEYCLGRVGMDSGTREVEVRLSPVAGHSGQERESEVWEERERGVSLLGYHFRAIMDADTGLLALVQ